MNNFQNGGVGTIQVQAGVRLKRVTPWRAEENDDEMIGWVLPRAHEVLVTTADEFDWCFEVRDIPACEVEDCRLNFKTDAACAGYMP